MASNDEEIRITLRLPAPLRDRVGGSARENNRSMNAEIVATLEEKYPEPQSFTYEELADALNNLAIMIHDIELTPGTKSLLLKLQNMKKAMEDNKQTEVVATDGGKFHLGDAAKGEPPAGKGG